MQLLVLGARCRAAYSMQKSNRLCKVRDRVRNPTVYREQYAKMQPESSGPENDTHVKAHAIRNGKLGQIEPGFFRAESKCPAYVWRGRSGMNWGA
jgi:hypothetical protein